MHPEKLIVKLKLDAEQTIAIKKFHKWNRGLCAYGTGTGKSLIIIANSIIKLNKGIVDKALIVATSGSSEEILESFEENTNTHPIYIKSLKDFISFCESSNKIGMIEYHFLNTWNFYIEDPAYKFINMEGKKKPKILGPNYIIVKNLLKKYKFCVSFDEFHTIRNMTHQPVPQMVRILKELRRYFKYSFGFTATPVMKGCYDIYNLVNYLDSSILGSKEEFTNKFVELRTKYIRARGRVIEVKEPFKLKNLNKLNRLLESTLMVTYYHDKAIDYERVEEEFTDWDKYDEIAKGLVRGERVQHSVRLLELQKLVNRSKVKRLLLARALKEHISEGVILYCARTLTSDYA